MFFFFFFFLSFCLLGLQPWHVEVSRLGLQSELKPLACTTATARQDLSCIFELHHSAWQHRIPNPLSKARAQTRNLMDASWVGIPLSNDRHYQNAICSTI